MESGNLGDLVLWGNDSDEYQQAVSKGMLFDWNEADILSDDGPYIKQNMPYALEKNANLSGGTVYGLSLIHISCIYGKRRYSFDPTAGILSVSSGH